MSLNVGTQSVSHLDVCENIKVRDISIFGLDLFPKLRTRVRFSSPALMKVADQLVFPAALSESPSESIPRISRGRPSKGTTGAVSARPARA
jgi:hypothetical protein